MPRSLEMNLSDSNFSKSSAVSPTPMKAIGDFVSETAERAPPPFAVPSSFVIITPVIPIESLKAWACWLASCPIPASRTMNF